MADVHSPEERSYNMSSIRGKDTKPEEIVRKYLFSKGFRYRKNATDLPGKPDIVLPKYRTCIFVNGCFWHVHVGCKYFVWPQNNADFWRKKLLANKERDKTVTEKLRESGWRVITIWECELKGDKAKNTLESLAWVIKASSQCRTGGDIDGKDDSGIDPNTI